MKDGSIHVLQGWESHGFFFLCDFQCNFFKTQFFAQEDVKTLRILNEGLATVSPTAPLNSAFARFGRMAADTGQIVWVLGEGVKGCWLVGVRRRQTRWRGRGGVGGTWGAVGERVAVVLEVWTDRWTDRCVNRRMDGRGWRAGWEWHRGGRG